MPKLIKRETVRIPVPQLRVLAALVGDDPEGPVPLLTRAAMCERAGFSPISGTVTRVLRGLAQDCKSGPAHPGIIELGYVSEVLLDVDGKTETSYQITDAGRAALARQLAELGDAFPALRDKASSINRRYKEHDDVDG